MSNSWQTGDLIAAYKRLANSDLSALKAVCHCTGERTVHVCVQVQRNDIIKALFI